MNIIENFSFNLQRKLDVKEQKRSLVVAQRLEEEDEVAAAAQKKGKGKMTTRLLAEKKCQVAEHKKAGEETRKQKLKESQA